MNSNVIWFCWSEYLNILISEFLKETALTISDHLILKIFLQNSRCDFIKFLTTLCIGNFGQLLPDMRIKDGNIAQLLSWCHTHWLSMRHFFLCIKLVSISFIGPFLKHPKGWNFDCIIGLWFYDGKAFAFNFSPWVEKQMVSI